MGAQVLITDSGHHDVAACSVRWWHRLAARSIAARLDRRIADGVPVDSDRGLVLRGHWLLSRRSRDRLADAWRDIADDASKVLRFGDPRIPLRRGQVCAAAPAIAELVGMLRGHGPVTARGVAMGWRIITDGGGPLYVGGHSLPEALRTVLDAMDPTTELTGTA